MRKSYFSIIFLVLLLPTIVPQRMVAQSNCIAPIGVTITANTLNTAVVTWAAPNTSSLYNLQYQASGTTTWTTLNNVTSPLTLTGLTCGSIYVAQIQQVCATATGATPTVSPWSASVTFTTVSCTPACNAPTGLTSTNVSQAGAVLNWTPTTTVANSYNIRYHSATTAAWTTVSNVSMPYQLGNLACGTGYEWQVQQICANNANPAIVSPWSTGSTFTTAACTPPTCNAPTGLTATNVSQTGAYLYLAPTSTNSGTFNLQYHVSGTNTWTTINNVTLPHQLSNLTCGTVYEWQAQLVCATTSAGSTNVSPWSTAATFITLACTPPACNAPTGVTVTANTLNTAVVTWAVPSASSLYNLQYQALGTSTWTTLNNVTSPLTLTGLTCGSVYVAQIQQVCATATGTTPTVSPWSASVTFTTVACTPACNAPTGLTSTNVSQAGAVLNWTPTTTVANSYNIQYHSATTTAWTTVSNVSMPYQLGNLTCGTGYEWQVQQICSSATANGNVIVSPWSMGSTFTTTACTPPTCNAPTGLTATNVSQTGAYLYLTPTSTNTGTFNLQYHVSGTTTWTTINNVTLPHQLSTLTCGTVYEWQAQLVCATTSAGSTNVSPWSTSGTFTTLACTPPACNAPTGVTVTANTLNTAVVTWAVPSASSLYNLQYQALGTSTWTTLNNVTNPLTLTGLTCGSVYVVQIQQVCATATGTTPTVSPWSASVTFTTVACTPTCNAPTGLTSTNVSQAGAVLNWTPTATVANSYNIQYHSATTTAWTTVSNVSMPYQLGNLTCGTGYEWQVQQICSSATANGNVIVSTWSTGSTFTTTACTPPTCNAPTGLTATDVSQTGAYLYLSPTSTNMGTFNLQYHVSGTTTWTAINNVTLPYQLSNLTCGTVYEWQAQLVCATTSAGSTNVSPWSTSGTFTTLACTSATCNAPTGLLSTNISQTSAVFSFNAVNGALLYIVRYKPVNSATTTYSTVTSNINSVAINGLIAGLYYTWQVETVCSTATITTNPWSIPAFFATPSLIIYPNPANQSTTLTFWSDQASSVGIEVRDSFGQLVYSENYIAVIGSNSTQIQTSLLSDGLYFAILHTNSGTNISKILVKH